MDTLTRFRSKTEAARDLVERSNMMLHRANCGGGFMRGILIDQAETHLRRASELLLFGHFALRAAELADELVVDDYARTLPDIAVKVWNFHDELCAAVTAEKLGVAA